MCIALDSGVQSAIVTVIGMLAIFFFTQFFNRSQRKHETKVKFFYEMYPKRLAVYEEVDDTLTEMCQYASKLRKMERLKANEIIISDLYKLNRLCHKLSIYGSLETWGIIGELFGQIRERSLEYLNIDIMSGETGEGKVADEVALGAFALSVVAVINSGYRVFMDSVRAEMGENFVDNEITDFLKKTVINKSKDKKKKPIE